MKFMSIQFAIQLIMTVLIAVQIVIGYRTIRHMTKLKAQQFHVQMLIDHYNKTTESTTK